MQVVEQVPPPKPLTSGWAAILKGKSEPAAPEPAVDQGVDSSATKAKDAKQTGAKGEEKRAKAPAAAAGQEDAAKGAVKPQQGEARPAESKESGASSETAEGKAAAAPPADAADSKPKEVRCGLPLLLVLALG